MESSVLARSVIHSIGGTKYLLQAVLEALLGFKEFMTGGGEGPVEKGGDFVVFGNTGRVELALLGDEVPKFKQVLGFVYSSISANAGVYFCSILQRSSLCCSSDDVATTIFNVEEEGIVSPRMLECIFAIVSPRLLEWDERTALQWIRDGQMHGGQSPLNDAMAPTRGS